MSSNVRNGLGQFSVAEPNTMIEGELAAGSAETRSAINPLENQVFTVTIGDGDGDGDGDFDIDVTGGRVDVNISYTDADNDDTEAEIAAALAAAFDPADDPAGLIKSVSANGAVVTVELNPNPMTLDVAGSGADLGTFTITAAETTAGAAIPFGRFVVISNGAAAIGIGAQEVALPGASTAAGDIAGIAYRDRLGVARGTSTSSTAVDQYAQGDVVGYARKAIVAMKVQGTVAAAASGAVYYGKPAAGVAGGAYASTASGNAVILPGCRFITAAAAGALAYVEINLPQ